jgi:hypothetical protein
MIAGALIEPKGIQKSINNAHTTAVSGFFIKRFINKTPPRKAVTGSWYPGATQSATYVQKQRAPVKKWRLRQFFLDTR